MIPSLREKDFQTKQEGENGDKTPSTSRQWSAFRNPRIVRVSRSFGGKDRHSKVCTIRGLRDRRIRLSVPTAIQLYDLQDRLGLGQPSKVIDWLLDATKDDIDKLPPLQIPQGFGQFHHPMLASHHHNHDQSAASQSSLAPFFDTNSTFMKDHHMGFHSLGIKINNTTGLDEDEQNAVVERSSKYWELDASLRAKSKEVEANNSITEKGKWVKTNEQDQNQDGFGNYSGQVSAQNLFPLASHSSLPGLLNNSLPFNPYFHNWDASNLSLSQFGGHGFPPQPDQNNTTTPSSQLALSTGSHQLFFCPPAAATMPSLFPPYPAPYITTPVEGTDQPREINHFQLLGSSSSQHILAAGSRPMTSPIPRPFSLNESQPEKDNSDS
ncbi:hypothetical protein Tsubulata_017508 [Turnera subulata]|uniref:TCP domain-containing protein n=1 Tax=Turnera subulata TaxID=218843 RepID=A0A9Q0FI13_9ROSI|nr:hypothetical protein Tsubulata_017508 [Turnera subulata]